LQLPWCMYNVSIIDNGHFDWKVMELASENLQQFLQRQQQPISMKFALSLEAFWTALSFFSVRLGPPIQDFAAACRCYRIFAQSRNLPSYVVIFVCCCVSSVKVICARHVYQGVALTLLCRWHPLRQCFGIWNFIEFSMLFLLYFCVTLLSSLMKTWMWSYQVCNNKFESFSLKFPLDFGIALSKNAPVSSQYSQLMYQVSVIVLQMHRLWLFYRRHTQCINSSPRSSSSRFKLIPSLFNLNIF
jgi:hypothetical protein